MLGTNPNIIHKSACMFRYMFKERQVLHIYYTCQSKHVIYVSKVNMFYIYFMET